MIEIPSNVTEFLQNFAEKIGTKIGTDMANLKNDFTASGGVVVTNSYSPSGTDAVSGLAVSKALEDYQKSAEHPSDLTITPDWTYTVPDTLDKQLIINCGDVELTSINITASGSKIPELDNEILIIFKASGSGCTLSTIIGTPILNNEVKIENGGTIAVCIFQGILAVKTLTNWA